jgi:CheY-like chemotaxis protein
MIVFVDDQPLSIKNYINSLRDKEYDLVVVDSPDKIFSKISDSNSSIECIVLDVMFPNDGTFSQEATNNGLSTGIPLYASIRLKLPLIPIVILTNSLDPTVENWFSSQNNCFFYRKVNLLPSEFAKLISDVILTNPGILIDRLNSCPPGRVGYNEFERICISIIEYLFIPPMRSIKFQVHRKDSHDIRDAVLEIDAVSGFWLRIQNEFNTNFVVFEFKNYKLGIRKSEVQQLRIYLRRKSMGKFGILISRQQPTQSAIIEQRDAYAEDDILILFCSDSDLIKMIKLRNQGKDPANYLRQLKTEFELSY